VAFVAIVATTLPFAEGIFKNGLLEIALLLPVAWLVLASQTREYALRSVLVLISLCFALTLVDLILRPVIGNRLHYSPMNLHQRRLPGLPMLGRWDAGVNFSGETYGDLAAMTGMPSYREPRHVEFRTDSKGFRNDLLGPPLTAIALGDSFTAGVGVTQAKTWPSVLGRQLEWSIYNLAYPGGPYEQYLNFSIESRDLPLTPGMHLIWTLYTGNDLDDTGGDTWDLDALPWQKGLSAELVNYRTFRSRSPLRQAWDSIRSRWSGISNDVVVRSLPDGRTILFYGPQEVWGLRGRAEVERHPNFAKLQTTLRALNETVARLGIQTTIIILPTKGEVYRWVLNPDSPQGPTSSGFAEAVLAVCRRMSLTCLDSRAYLESEAKRLFHRSQELLWWRDDTHLNDRGHEALAAFVMRAVAGGSPTPGGQP
jgi:lysophospholipase L1-like esterase